MIFTLSLRFYHDKQYRPRDINVSIRGDKMSDTGDGIIVMYREYQAYRCTFVF